MPQISTVSYCHTHACASMQYLEFQDGIEHMYSKYNDVSTASTFWID